MPGFARERRLGRCVSADLGGGEYALATPYRSRYASRLTSIRVDTLAMGGDIEPFNLVLFINAQSNSFLDNLHNDPA